MTYIHLFQSRFAYVMVALLWANVVLLIAAVSVAGAQNGQALILAGAALAATGTVMWILAGTRWPTRQISSIAALGQVMLLVHALQGHAYQVDMHMYFFAVLAVLAGWTGGSSSARRSPSPSIMAA